MTKCCLYFVRYGVDLRSLHVIAPTAPRRKLPKEQDNQKSQFARMFYTYTGQNKVVNGQEVWDSNSTISNQTEFWEFVNENRQWYRDMCLNDSDPAPLVVSATSLGGPLALQFGCEMGASLIWLNRSAPDMNLFDRDAVLKYRPKGASKTKLMIVLGEYDEVYSLEYVYNALSKLVEENSDIFCEPFLFVQKGRRHGQSSDDVATLATALVRRPFSCIEPEWHKAHEQALEKPAWPELVNEAPEFREHSFACIGQHPRILCAEIVRDDGGWREKRIEKQRQETESKNSQAPAPAEKLRGLISRSENGDKEVDDGKQKAQNPFATTRRKWLIPSRRKQSVH